MTAFAPTPRPEDMVPRPFAQSQPDAGAQRAARRVGAEGLLGVTLSDRTVRRRPAPRASADGPR